MASPSSNRDQTKRTKTTKNQPSPHMIPITETIPESSPKTSKPVLGNSSMDNKRRKLNKGKGKAHELSESDHEIVVCDGVTRPLFREFLPHATSLGLDKLRLTKHERILVNRVKAYSIHGGRYFPKQWYEKIVALWFFDEFLKFQGWDKVCAFSGPIYPIEMVQFFASVSMEDGVLHAVVNGIAFSVSVDDFCSAFSVPHDGIEINPSQEWHNVSGDEKMVIKRYFDESATVNSVVVAGCFTPKLKFFFNFLWNTVVPRKGGRDKVSSYELIMVHSWL